MKLNEINTSQILIALSLILGGSIMVSILLTLSLNKNLSPDKFYLQPSFIPNINDTTDIFNITPMKKNSFNKSEFEDLTKKLIEEYITIRYTVNGSTYLMNENLGIYEKEDIATKGSHLKLPSYRGKNGTYTLAYQMFQNNKSKELDEIKKLMEGKTTRSVLILTQPFRYKDRWRTTVEFIYKIPTSHTIEEARRERWQIDMDVEDLTGFRPLSSVKGYLPQNPSSLFGFQVNWIEKTKL